MQEEFLKELGLSPRWVRKTIAAAAPPAAAATAPEKNRALAAAVPVAAPAASPTPAAAADAFSPAGMNWQQLQAAVESCQRCALCKERKKPAFGSGDRQATVMLIGEGPGAEEDRQGEPFVGPAGKLLDLMLHAIGLDRKRNVYIANIVKCRPPGNRNPTVEEAQLCLPYLQRQIALVQPHVLVALGKVAATHLLGSETSIAQLRQKMHEYGGMPLVVTYHPAYLLRNPREKRKSWEDLKFLRKLIAEDGG